MKAVKTFNVRKVQRNPRKRTRQCSNPNGSDNEILKEKILESRKEDINEIIKVIDDISKKEIAKTKQLWNDHVNLFKSSPEKDSVQDSDKIESLDSSIDDEYFE